MLYGQTARILKCACLTGSVGGDPSSFPHHRMPSISQERYSSSLADMDQETLNDKCDDYRRQRRKSNEIKISFARKTRTMEILRTRLEKEEQEEVEDEHFQFMRAAKLAQNTRRIMISHNAENKEYGRFLMRIFDNLGLDVENTIIFTSDTKTGVPHGVNVYDYLKDCFREDVYVIFLFSRHFYDSNVCIAETGAAWATNRNHSNCRLSAIMGHKMR